MAVSAPELRSLFFEPGKKVRIQPFLSDRTYDCLIEEAPNGSIHVSMPMEGRDYAKIRTGERVRVAVERRGNLYLFDSIVTGRMFGEFPVLIVKRPPDRTAIQRREHFRVPVLLQGVLAPVQREGQPRERDIRITIVDLSASGLGFRAEAHFELGRAVEIDFALPVERRRAEISARSPVAPGYARRWPAESPGQRFGHYHRGRDSQAEPALGEVLTVLARVVHCTSPKAEPERDPDRRQPPPIPTGSALSPKGSGLQARPASAQPERDDRRPQPPPVCRAGVEFTEISDVARERIIHFVMRREVELRSRGLL